MKRIYLPVLGQAVCPASICPLFAKDGSPWTGEKNARCPQHEHDPESPGSDGCSFWWGRCDGESGARSQVEEAHDHGGTLQLGPVRQRRHKLRQPSQYECPKAEQCQWQKQSGPQLCPPRQALALGVDPRACAY